MSEVKVKKGNDLIDYLQDSVQELKKVTWPTRNQAVRLTLLVLGFCFAAAVVIGAVDMVFSYGHRTLVDYAAMVNPAPITETATETTPLTQPVTTTQPVVNVGTEQPAPAEVPTGSVTVTTPPATPTPQQ